jgi:two-component system response regulator FlrC
MDKKILVVDDEAGMRLALSEVLKRCGYQVAAAQDGVEALRQLEVSCFDLVISDVKMPRLDGMAMLQKIRERIPDLPVIMITAFGTVDKAVEAMKMGASDFIQKPFSLEDIESMVHRLFDRERSAGKAPVNGGGRGTTEIITQNKHMLKLMDLARTIARSQASVLVCGESGTGKELFARLIHESSPRNQGPFVAVNCAAIPENLLESELFGHERGSFTGALFQRIGKFELANHGTILLDEVSEMNSNLQAKLLRVLQEFEIDRIGGKKPVKLDVRVVATTNLSLEKEMREGRFREDLYYRLNVIPIKIPPLRERREDIPLLTRYFMKRYSEKIGKTVNELTEDALHYLQNLTWKGNVRELENLIERAVLITCDLNISLHHLTMFEETAAQPLREESAFRPQAGISMREMEKSLIIETLNQVEGNRTHAAKMLGISIRTLRNKINEYRLRADLLEP